MAIRAVPRRRACFNGWNEGSQRTRKHGKAGPDLSGLAGNGVGSRSIFALHFLEQPLDGVIQLLPANIPVTDDALGVKDVNRRPSRDVPPAGDGSERATAVPPRAPGDLLLLEDVLEFVSIRVAIRPSSR